MPTMQRIAIVGFGLIGGSLAAALHRSTADIEIVAVVLDPGAAAQAMQLDSVSEAIVGVESGIAGADMVVLCVPMLAMRGVLDAVQRAWMNGALDPAAIITDAGSVKCSFVADARATFSSNPAFLTRVVPGHPVAGRETSGMLAADPDLYRGRRVLLTPMPETEPAALEMVRRMWERTGAEVESMSPEHHDRVLAATSHLPHVLAYSLVDTLATQQEAEEIFRYAAGGFRDFSRIASSDPVMWRDVCLSNRTALLNAMDAFSDGLQHLREAVESRDANALQTLFTRAKAARDAFTH